MPLKYLPLLVALVALAFAIKRLCVLQFGRGNTEPSVAGTFALLGVAVAGLGFALLDETSWGADSSTSSIAWVAKPTVPIRG